MTQFGHRLLAIADRGRIVVSLGTFVLLWWAAVKVFDPQPFIIPSPSAVLSSLNDLVRDDRFWGHVVVTTRETLYGFAVACIAGVVLAVAITEVRLFDILLSPLVVAFQTVPKVALAPIFLVWFGYGETSKVVIAATIAFFPILVNTMEGLKSPDLDEIEMMRSFGGTRLDVLRRVRARRALPFFFAGLDIGIVLAIIGAVVGEFVGSSQGLGFLILQANIRFDTASMFAILIVLSLLGLIAHGIIRQIQTRTVFWTAAQRMPLG